MAPNRLKSSQMQGDTAIAELISKFYKAGGEVPITRRKWVG
jgi:hypothetical protein